MMPFVSSRRYRHALIHRVAAKIVSRKPLFTFSAAYSIGLMLRAD
jgi:hypothetical protein